MTRLEEADVATSLRSKDSKASKGASIDDLTLPVREEAASSELAREASPADKMKGKVPAEQDDEQAELIRMNPIPTSTLKNMR